jgi:NTP pyrophosphatase (non-canonical NTP hydrolase)
MSDFTFAQLQEEHKQWVDYNFPDREPYYHLLGAVEELGELAHAHLKGLERVRGTHEEHEAKAKDAVADVIIFLAGYCSDRGFDLQEIIEATWQEVRQRDWQKNPVSGQA